ncbi:hypothetical protein HF329_01370 [Chitinophaga oryzae]|uniref:Uncharacterized protein n=1 Tax=Chitinophaga oryzae TaxID=2725414 RepID=A0AAE7D5G4_9BACT|nr:hypothetical protein [Chitinophaga oryzae]QJB30029.1 hypothetical protein HF329_01370 [Chitinophaga oryzae]
MKFCFLILSTMFSLFTSGQQPGSSFPALTRHDSIGKGILQISFGEKIPLYANATDKTPFDTLVIRQKKDGSYAFLTKVLKNRFEPYRLSEGDTYETGRANIQRGLVHFPAEMQLRVVEATSTHFRVVINEKEKLTCYIHRQPGYTLYNTLREKESSKGGHKPRWYLYETWEHLLQRVYLIEVKKGIPLFESPDGHRIPYPKREDSCEECFRVGEVRGAWAQLLDRNDYQLKKKPYGWVKWHNGTAMYITYMEFGYE